MNLGILGLGNMGSAIINGIIANKVLSEKEIMGFDVLPEKRDYAEKKLNILCKSEDQVCDFAEIIIIAVKPSDLPSLLTKIKDPVKNKIILSICAGVPISKIEDILGTD